MPPEYALWGDLDRFDVGTNHLSGTLPLAYGEWKKVTRVILNFNDFSGTLPKSYASWTSIQSFLVSGNRISGALPAELATLQFDVLCLDTNDFSGVVPVLHVSRVLTLQNNARLVGSLPPTMGPTLVVSLCNTSLCGALPLWWSIGLSQVTCLASPSTNITALTEAALSAPVYTVPSCGMTPAPSSSSATPNASSHVRVIASASYYTPLGITGVVAVGAAHPGGSALLQASQRSVAIALRLRTCGGDDERQDVGGTVGDIIADSPTRLLVPGRLPLTTGAVIGNALLLLCVPLVLVAVGRAVSARRRRRRTHTSLVVGLQVVYFVCGMSFSFRQPQRLRCWW